MAEKSSDPSSLARFINGILPENPVLRLVLGICPNLAVTSSVEGALTMGLAATFVLFCSNAIISLLKKFLQPHLRKLRSVSKDSDPPKKAPRGLKKNRD